MKKIAIMMLLAMGCGASTQVPAYQAAPVVEAPAPEPEVNPYIGAVSFLRALLNVSVERFQQACSEFEGEYYVTDDIHTCEKKLSGFSIEVINGKNTASSLLVPGNGGELLAKAIVEEVGAPHQQVEGMFVWALRDGTLYFANLDNVAFIAVLDTTEY